MRRRGYTLVQSGLLRNIKIFDANNQTDKPSYESGAHMSDISAEQIDNLIQDELAKKYEEFRELARSFLVWQHEYEVGEFLWNEEGGISLEKARASDENLVWTVISNDEHVAISGFEEHGDRVEGWFIANVPCERFGTILPLETHIDCQVCDASGEVDDDSCPECDSQGDIFFRIDY